MGTCTQKLTPIDTTKDICWCSLSSTEQLVVTADRRAVAKVWDLATAYCIQMFAEHAGWRAFTSAICE